MCTKQKRISIVNAGQDKCSDGMMTCVLGDETAYSPQIANVEIDCFAQVTNVNGHVHLAIKCYTQIFNRG